MRLALCSSRYTYYASHHALCPLRSSNYMNLQIINPLTYPGWDASEILFLPISSGLTEEQQKLVARQIREYISSGAGVTTSCGDVG